MSGKVIHMRPPELVCVYSPDRTPHARKAPDSQEARAETFWRKRTPKGISKTVALHVQLWPQGWGAGKPVTVLRVLTGEKAAPPVAGSMPQWLKLLLPSGAIRTANLTRLAGDVTYALSLRPGEVVTVTRPVIAMPGEVGRGIRKRLAARRAAGGEE